MTWRWTAIAPDAALAGERAPTSDGVIFDERWLALVLLAKQTNARTRAGYRRDINTFMRWWNELRPAGLSTAARPLEASRSDIEQYAAWLASAEPPLAAATRARRLAVVSAFYELADREAAHGGSPRLRGRISATRSAERASKRWSPVQPVGSSAHPCLRH